MHLILQKSDFLFPALRFSLFVKKIESIDHRSKVMTPTATDNTSKVVIDAKIESVKFLASFETVFLLTYICNLL